MSSLLQRSLRVSAVLATGIAAAIAIPTHQPMPAGGAASRCGDPGLRPWCNTSLSPDKRAGLLLAAMTLDERISLLAGDELTGVGGQAGMHTGTSNGIERLGVPPIYFSDGPVGTRQGQATGMPSPMSLAASFDPANAWRHAAVVGDEVKKKGNDVVYAPAVNMMRTPLNGRTFEYFGEDPYLSSQITVGWIKGVQAQGVIGNVKHFAANNQEGTGLQIPGAPVGGAVIGSRMTVNAVIDERTLREIYLPQFEAAVTRGNVGSVMCSYNRLNGQYACENQHLLNEILKRDWRFKGLVLTDYGAAKNTVASLNNGLDLDIWPAVVYNPLLVNAALEASLVSVSTVDEHVRRILRTMFAFGLFDRPAYVDDSSRIDQAAHNATAAAVEQEGIVLLKNDQHLLPLRTGALKKLAVIGPEANTLKDGGGSSAINEFRTTTPLQALTAKLGANRVVYDDGSDVARAAQVAKTADVAIVVVGDRMTEGSDKSSLDLDADQADGIDRDALIAAVADVQPKTVVVLQTGGPVLTPWRGKARAILEMWYPGQNGGTALARVLFGAAEPGGRLPATFPARAGDLPTAGDQEMYPGVLETVTYKEGVFIGYRHYDAKRITPAYPFGFGLTYTSFGYSRPIVKAAATGVATVTFKVTNTGHRAGTAVPQLYLGLPSPGYGVRQPPRQLKRFARVWLRPGETKRVTLRLDRRALSYWDTAADGWQIAPGCYRVLLGGSSRDIRGTALMSWRSSSCGRYAVKVG